MECCSFRRVHRSQAGQTPAPKTHRLEATPSTVAYGYYWTGPVFVEGAEPGDALEVKVLSIDLPIDYGYNGCSGMLEISTTRNLWHGRAPKRRQISSAWRPIRISKVATTLAIQEMVDFLAANKGLTKHQAYQLVSIAGNVAITQLVDRPVVGVHVKMPKSIFQR